MRTIIRTSAFFALLALAAACSPGGQEPVDVGETGERPPPPTEPTTTTTTEPPPTTLVPSEVDIPPLPEWAEGWEGPSSDLGELKVEDFNAFVLDNAPAEATPAEAVVAYLQLTDPGDAQMFVGEAGGPEATMVTVVFPIEGDDSVRAMRYEFVLEPRSRRALLEAELEATEAEEGDLDLVEDELDTDEGDAATEEEIEVVEGPDAVPWILRGELTVQCQPGRGQQDFLPELCL